jgi:hypothetical protein
MPTPAPSMWSRWAPTVKNSVILASSLSKGDASSDRHRPCIVAVHGPFAMRLRRTPSEERSSCSPSTQSRRQQRDRFGCGSSAEGLQAGSAAPAEWGETSALVRINASGVQSSHLNAMFMMHDGTGSRCAPSDEALLTNTRRGPTFPCMSHVWKERPSRMIRFNQGGHP